VTTPWLTVIGAGEGDLPALPLADTVLGPARLKARVPRLVEWRSPKLDAMLAQIMEYRGRPTIVLASGDPMWFGIGATLARHLMPDEYRVDPGPSSFQLAAARLHWPLQRVTTLSLHARPVEALHPHVLPGHRILALTTDAGTARDVAQLLTDRGYGQSMLTVLENLAGPSEVIAAAEARTFALSHGDLYVLGIDCVADTSAPLLPSIGGLPDDAFISDGQLTKREVRATTLARLAPYPGARLWDVGAGCGSVAIEWMRAARYATAIAFERDPTRREMIARNTRALGTPGLAIVGGDAPASLAGQPAPDAVFLGGDVANAALFEACWAALRPAGRLVANAVTLDGEQALFARQAELGGELVRIDVATLDTVGAHRVLRPRLPVTQWAVQKP